MKVGIYVRCSTAAHERETLVVQKEQCTRFCDFKEWEIHDYYVDDGYSAGDTNRPELQRLLRDAENRTIDGIVIWKLDRFARNARDTLNLIDNLENWGCNFGIATQNIDCQTTEGKLFRTMLAGFAEFERDTFVDRVGSTKTARLANWDQYLPHGKPPFGYRYVNPKKSLTTGEKVGYYVNDVEADVVREIFKSYIKGVNRTQIANRLRGRGYSMNESSIKNILTREVYVSGKHPVRYRGTSKTVKIPTIIDRQRWKKVQEILSHPHQIHQGKPQANPLLKKKIRCVCGETLYHYNITAGNGKTYTYYRHKCNGKDIGLPAEEVESKVWNSIVEKLADTKGLEATIQALKDQNTEEKFEDLEIQKKALEVHIHNLEGERDRAATKYIETSDEAYDKIRAKKSMKIREFEHSIGKIEEELEQIQNTTAKIRNADDLVRMIQKDFGRLDNLGFEDRLDVIEKMYDVGSITFYPKKWIDEHWDVFELLFPKLKESGIKLKLGVLVLAGHLDIDYQKELESPPMPDMKKLKEQIELYRNHSER